MQTYHEDDAAITECERATGAMVQIAVEGV